MAEINVLYVDDEQQNLNSFRAVFRRRYNVFSALTVPEAFEIIEREEIHVLLSDQRMPEVTGVEFLKQSKERYPNIPRILLTGYTDVEVLANAVNEGDIYRYITKPWDELEIHNGILNAYDAYKAGRSLREKVEELERINDGLNRFVYSLSHELRAPIASASGVLDLVKMDGVFDDEGGYWKLMEACVKKMEYYVNQTVQFYKTARFSMDSEPLHFNEMIQSLLGLHKATGALKDIEVKMDINEEEAFCNDAFRVEIILANLLSNAIKNQRADAADKNITIKVQTSKENATIIIEDNGVGIHSKDLERIFDQFFKGESPDGLGLGLYILKESLDKLKGTISVESTPGIGSSFRLLIPNLVETQQMAV